MELTATVDAACSSEDAFAVLSDFERNPEWQIGMKSAVWTSEPPLRVGSTYDQVARFGGRDVITAFEVVDVEPGRSVTIESRASTFPIRVTRTVTDLGDGRTRIEAAITGGPGGFLKLLAPLMRRAAQRSVTADYQRLKELLER